MKYKRIPSIFFGSFLAALVTLLLARLVDVQLVQGQRFFDLADDNRFFSLVVPPTRGVLLDRSGELLVENSRRYYKKVQPLSLYSETELMSDSEGLALLATSGGQVERKMSRVYPFGSVLAHTIGYLSPVTAEDREKDKTLLPSQSIGKMGLEAWFNQELRGIPGSEVWEINAKVSRQRKVSEQLAQEGQSIQTSLDAELSKVAAAALEGKRGSVIVADASTGKLLTIVSSPSFDPNLFVTLPQEEQEKNQRQTAIKELFANPDKPFFNRAVSGVYPPGSIFKIVTALAGLEVNAFDASTTVLDEGVLRVGEYEYGNWYYRQYGRTDGNVGLIKALAHSNDIFFYKAAEWTGVNQLATMAQLLGFGQATGIELSNEAAGLVPTPAWKEQVVGEPWYLGNTYHMGIGQGDMLVTPVQIAQLVQTVANRGQLCVPSLVQDGVSQCRSLSLQEKNIDLVLEGMLDACSPNGTAFPFFERNRLLRPESAPPETALKAGAVACKTGTAEFGGVDENGHRKTHGWWVGVVEPQKEFKQLAVSEVSATESGEVRQQKVSTAESVAFPKRVVMAVLVESDDEVPFREGSRDAAPIGKQLLDSIEAR